MKTVQRISKKLGPTIVYLIGLTIVMLQIRTIFA